MSVSSRWGGSGTWGPSYRVQGDETEIVTVVVGSKGDSSVELSPIRVSGSSRKRATGGVEVRHRGCSSVVEERQDGCR